ncbi:unnamed protein product [Enterobius vermicularis]|uniref:Anion exchange protein n=1 Tax=Enterobius vermicularis TaxID=51028 RepID=A0A0N4V6P1_ENTVE|nr:unnamed protein product [Enterobius vermicularis]
MFLLKERSEAPALFTEMNELQRAGPVEEWRETARWVKFEEDVEEGGNRWSKPHVATLSLHSLFQLRSCLLNGIVIIDSDSTTLSDLIEESERDQVRQVLLRRHRHQYEQVLKLLHLLSTNGSFTDGLFLTFIVMILQAKGANNGVGGGQGGFLNAVRSISDMGRSLSGRNVSKAGEAQESSRKSPNLLESSHQDIKGNIHFMKKLPPGAEASNVLVGEVDFLTHHITALVRLKTASLLGDLTEVPVPTRFFFVLLGPTGHASQYRGIGRAIATLMSDEVFHDVAYKARDRTDFLDGVDEFLDQENGIQIFRKEKMQKIYYQEKEMKVKPIEDEDAHGNDPALKRTGKLFGGLIADIKRKAPWYISDFTDSLNLQCLATFCFMYFALLAPIVTFGGLLEEATHQRMAAMENLFGGAICGVFYHLFSGQPLTIIGSTGPVLVFETIVFEICDTWKIDYLSFRFWVHVWTALILFIMVITDASSLVSYITRFTEESFATLIAVIFIYEAICKLARIGSQLDVVNYSYDVRYILYIFQLLLFYDTFNYSAVCFEHDCNFFHGKLHGKNCFFLYDKFLMSLVLMLGTFFLAITFKKMRNSCYFPSRIRQIFSDFAVMISIVIMTSIDFFVGINTPKLNVPSSFRPTWEGRGWIIPPFNGNPFWTAPLAAVPALLACILIFMDQQITTVIVNRKENKLKKGCGYHLDLCVLSALIVIVGFLGLPIYVAATVLSINHVNSLKVESESRAPGEVAQFIGVREQRVTGMVTFLFIGLSVMMTGLLSHIPMPVLYGVFLYMGIAALGGIQLFDRILLLFMPMKYQPDTIYIRHVPISVIHRFTFCQVACLGVLWTVKSIKSTSISFPIMLVVMVAVRKFMEKFFTERDLKYLDDKMPEFHLRKKEDMSKAEEEIDIDLEENQGTIHAVKTKAHLHIPMASGNVIKIPLAAIQEPSHNINISNEVNQSGLWKHIASESHMSICYRDAGASDIMNEKPDEAIDDEEAIMINIVRPSPPSSSAQISGEDAPLLSKKTSEERL